MTTLAPWSKNNFAVACPMPPAPPVIRATLFFKRSIFNCLFRILCLQSLKFLRFQCRKPLFLIILQFYLYYLPLIVLTHNGQKVSRKHFSMQLGQFEMSFGHYDILAFLNGPNHFALLIYQHLGKFIIIYIELELIFSSQGLVGKNANGIAIIKGCYIHIFWFNNCFPLCIHKTI